MNYSELFLLDAKKGNTAGLRYRVKWDGKEAAFSLGYRVEIDKWSQEANRCIRNTTHGNKKISARLINQQIEAYQSYTREVFNSIHNPSAKEFKTEFNILRGKIKRQAPIDFFNGFDQFRKETGTKNRWSYTTHLRFKEIKRKLYLIDPNFDFETFGENEMNKIVSWFISNNYLNSTTTKAVKDLLRYIKWAHIKGYYPGKVHDTYKLRLKGARGKNQVIYFTWDELMEMWEYKPNSERLERVKDYILFLSFTGLRHSDYNNLNPSDFTSDGIYITTQKDVDRIMIEFNKYSRAIAEKYEYNLPKISNVKANKYLKELCKDIGFNDPIKMVEFSGNKRHEYEKPKHELVTTHIGRKTFIVNGLRLGISTEVIMKWTGHSDYKAMMPYIQIVDELKKSEMSKFDSI